MRDLEIRGAGNLLGTGQSGHIAAVGYDLYCQMVSEAVAELKGERVARAGRDQARPARSTPTCPRTTSPRRSCGSRPTAGWPRSPPTPRSTTSAAEWVDRYGPVPGPPAELLAVARLRAECDRLGIREITVVKAQRSAARPRRPPVPDDPRPASRSASSASSRPPLQGGAELVVLPVPKSPDLASTMVDLLRKLVPPAED